MIRIGWGEIVSLMWALGVKDRDHMESRLVSPMTEAEKRGFPAIQRGYRIALAVLVVTAVAGGAGRGRRGRGATRCATLPLP